MFKISKITPQTLDQYWSTLVFPKPALNSAIFTQMASLGFYLFSTTIVPNSYATTGNRTHGRVEPDRDLWRTLYRLSFTTAAPSLNMTLTGRPLKQKWWHKGWVFAYGDCSPGFDSRCRMKMFLSSQFTVIFCFSHDFLSLSLCLASTSCLVNQYPFSPLLLSVQVLKS